ncbi:uncharacterized protein C8A04DRAFT_26128 [Dichotomopilus funicola]|uniref:Uncharacterized protein n=1 Tax=Dichotomopilus funicola TaxID=1934379 RepID=A0AAN6V6Z0_9PEZI|nr:hypothetical protein C8A04DRAFT_26128 [Dichotomopilus funicola]
MPYLPEPTANTPKPTAAPFPPASIPNSHLPTNFPADLTSPTALRVPATWRCGTCTSVHSIVGLLLPPSASSTPSTPSPPSPSLSPSPSLEPESPCTCACPALQAVYDQFGELYLFWRDDPAISDLRLPQMAAEARWRVWTAGGDEWCGLEGLDKGPVDVRPRTGRSDSSASSEPSENPMRPLFSAYL